MKQYLIVLLVVSTWASMVSSTEVAAEGDSRVEMLHMWRTSSEQHALAAYADAIRSRNAEWYDYAVDNNFAGVQAEFSQRIALGEPPTVVQWIVGDEMKGLAEAGITRIIKDENGVFEKRLHPEVYELVRSEEGLVGLPVGIHTQNHVVYNAEILERFKLDVPESFEQFLAYGPVLKEAGIYLLSASNQQWQQRILFNAILASLLTHDEFRTIMKPLSDVSDMKGKFKRAFMMQKQMRAYAEPNDRDREWEEAAKIVDDGKALAIILGDYVVPQISNQDKIECTTSPGAKYILWGMDSFILLETEERAALTGQEMMVDAVLSTKASSEYIRRKGGVPVTNDVPVDSLSPCSSNVYQTWQQVEDRIWTGGDVWRQRFAALAAIAKKAWGDPDVDAESYADTLVRALSAI